MLRSGNVPESETPGTRAGNWFCGGTGKNEPVAWTVSYGKGRAVVQNYISAAQLDLNRFTTGTLAGFTTSPLKPGRTAMRLIASTGPVSATAITPMIYQAQISLKIAHEVCPQAKLILGGIHPTFMYGQVLSEAPWIDYEATKQPWPTTMFASGKNWWSKAITSSKPATRSPKFCCSGAVLHQRPFLHPTICQLLVRWMLYANLASVFLMSVLAIGFTGMTKTILAMVPKAVNELTETERAEYQKAVELQQPNYLPRAGHCRTRQIGGSEVITHVGARRTGAKQGGLRIGS